MVEEFIHSTDAWADASVRIATSYDEALDAFKEQQFDVAFFDYLLGARDGLSLLREIRHNGVDTPVIVLTSQGAEDVAVEAMKTGAADYLSKASLTVEARSRPERWRDALRVWLGCKTAWITDPSNFRAGSSNAWRLHAR